MIIWKFHFDKGHVEVHAKCEDEDMLLQDITEEKGMVCIPCGGNVHYLNMEHVLFITQEIAEEMMVEPT